MKKSAAPSILLAALLLSVTVGAEAQQTKMYRVGVILPGGAWYETIDGLRFGLKQIGLEDKRQLNLVVRETKGDAKAAEITAKNFEQEKVDLLYTTATSVTIAARRATADIPIVFCAGADPVDLGLVDSFAKPNGRLTGVFYRDTDLTAKRLEILKEIVPTLRHIVTFYDPRSVVSSDSAKLVREEIARIGGVKFTERHVFSVDDLQAGLRILKPGEVEAIFEVSDALVQTHDQLIIGSATVKRLATMFINQSSVVKGGLASYSVSRYEVGRVSAKYVQRVLKGVNPKDLPVEGVDKIALTINLKAAKQIGLTVPPNLLVRADRVIK
jgi:putative ABC transport system substrate-binding protein